MSRRRVWILIAALLIAAGAGAALWWMVSTGDEESDAAIVEEQSPDVDEGPEPEATRPCDLYFPGAGGHLSVEPRELPADADSAARVTDLVEALIAGPQGASLRPPLPDGVTVGQVYLMDGGTVILDLESAEPAPPASGSLREMLTVYSLVNTVLFNVEEAEQLVLLWNGQQPSTFAGHLNTAQPLLPNTRLVARR
ncbi:MAG: GerMN domain-containing protein [bacterium]|nr:GerMN domain-containing protein [bacterium]